MPLYESDAFVLRTYKLGESDQIVVFFTREFGKLRAVCRRSQNPRRHMGGYYQPLTLLHAILFGRPSKALYRINTVDIVEPFRSLHEDFGHLRCGLYMTELIDVATREQEPAPELFTLLHLGFDQLAKTSHAAMLLRVFELRLLMAIGYTPQLLYCARCAVDMPRGDGGVFSAPLGGLICRRCTAEVRQILPVSQATVAFLRLVTANDTSDWTGMPIEADAQEELERILHAHLTTCLGRELKSYAFLHL